MNSWADPGVVLRLVEQIAAIGVCVSSAEWLAQPGKIREGGIFSWNVLQLRATWMMQGARGTAMNAVFQYPQVMALFALRLAAGLVLAAPGIGETARIALTLFLAVVALLLRLRSPFGLDGSDQMSSIILVTVALANLIGTPFAISACLWFIALQGCLAYATSGCLKLKEKGWRDGTYLARIFASRTYGHPLLGGALTSHGWLAAGLSMAVVVLETVFPAALLLPEPLTIALLAAGLSFHVTTGLIMGLNTFVWSFVATYPAIVYCARLVPY